MGEAGPTRSLVPRRTAAFEKNGWPVWVARADCQHVSGAKSQVANEKAAIIDSNQSVTQA